ncbi:MAG: hypothetical protein MI717_06135 [Spirochaetales bacterium]|nr:hypothetical protein [Spirochaetales bacterium]
MGIYKKISLLWVIILGLVIELSGITLRFGAQEGWQDAPSNGLRETDGWMGGTALTLAPLGRNPFQENPTMADTGISPESIDILLLAEESGLSNPVGRYRLQGPVSVSNQFSSRGEYSFRPGINGLTLIPTKNSLWTPGTQWNDFTLDFRLRPATLRHGEVFFSWQGRSNDGTPQSVTAIIENRRMVWTFQGFFRRNGSRSLNLRLKSPPLIPGEWSHHRLRFSGTNQQSDRTGASPGLLEYLVDGIPSDSVHATPDGKEREEVFFPHIGSLTTEAPVLAPAFSGYIDEFRLVSDFDSRPAAGGYANRDTAATGVGSLPLTDTGYPGSSLHHVRVRYEAPGATRVRFYARTFTTIPEQTPLPDPGNPKWIPLQLTPSQEDPTGFGRWHSWETQEPLKGRYFTVGYILEPDPGTDTAPLLSALEVDFSPRYPPRPPRNLRLLRDNDGNIQLSWSPDAEPGVSGWWVFWGPRPGDYTDRVPGDSRHGSAWIPKTQGTERPKYILPLQPGGGIVYASVRAAWPEGEPRNDHDSVPADYAALGEPTGEVNVRP